MIRNQQILVAILNWGLGHATRSIPIIEKLTNDGNAITIASDGDALRLLKSVFPNNQCLELPGYDVTYPSTSMVWNIARKLPGIYKTMKREKKIIDQWIKEHPVEVIISDNRYGCYHPSTRNVFVSHQLNLQVPFGSLVNSIHARLINKFDEVWVVDTKDGLLSGDLSSTKWLDPSLTIQYLGPQSRLGKTIADERYDIAAILSGPEPQRTYLEQLLNDQLSTMDVKAVLVRGSLSVDHRPSTSNMTVIDFADKATLSKIISGSELVICRSGYSSIMDLAKIESKALFVATPGQTEQIYLAKRLAEKGIADHQNQSELDIPKAWKERHQFTGFMSREQSTTKE